MFSCKDVSEKASDYVDGELSFMNSLKMRLHLLICDHCRRYLKQFKATIQLSRSLSPIAPNDSEVEDQIKQLLAMRSKTD